MNDKLLPTKFKRPRRRSRWSGLRWIPLDEDIAMQLKIWRDFGWMQHHRRAYRRLKRAAKSCVRGLEASVRSLS